MPDDLMGRAEMGSRVGTYTGRTEGVHVDMEEHIEL